MLEELALVASGAAVLTVLAILIYNVAWLFGVDLLYVIKLVIKLREDRQRFKQLAQQILEEELAEVAALLSVTKCNMGTPRLVIDLRYEEVPAGRFLAPGTIFVQHTKNITRLRETIRHEVIHFIHYNCIEEIPWSEAERFAANIRYKWK